MTKLLARNPVVNTCELVLDNRWPTSEGRPNPPRFPTELIRPKDAAAADSPSVKVGSTQKEGVHANSTAPVAQSHNITAGNGVSAKALSGKKSPASPNGTAVCHLRSPRRSEERPASTTETSATTKGSAENAVEKMADRPDAF